MSDFMTALAAWQEDVRQLAILKRRESETRRSLFEAAFPDPSEGTNRRDLPDGRVLVGGYNLTRKINEASLHDGLTALAAAGCGNPDDVIVLKPELVKSAWNRLTETQKLAFSQALITTPGAPTLKVEG